MSFYTTNITGVTFTNDDGTSRQKYIEKLKPDDKLMLIREKNNKYDSNAVAVHDMKLHKLGYIPKHMAGSLSKQIDAGKTFEVFVLSCGQNADGKYGAKIHIEDFANKKHKDLGAPVQMELPAETVEKSVENFREYVKQSGDLVLADEFDPNDMPF